MNNRHWGKVQGDNEESACDVVYEKTKVTRPQSGQTSQKRRSEANGSTSISTGIKMEKKPNSRPRTKRPEMQHYVPRARRPQGGGGTAETDGCRDAHYDVTGESGHHNAPSSHEKVKRRPAKELYAPKSVLKSHNSVAKSKSDGDTNALAGEVVKSALSSSSSSSRNGAGRSHSASAKTPYGAKRRHKSCEEQENMSNSTERCTEREHGCSQLTEEKSLGEGNNQEENLCEAESLQNDALNCDKVVSIEVNSTQDISVLPLDQSNQGVNDVLLIDSRDPKKVNISCNIESEHYQQSLEGHFDEEQINRSQSDVCISEDAATRTDEADAMLRHEELVAYEMECESTTPHEIVSMEIADSDSFIDALSNVEMGTAGIKSLLGQSEKSQSGRKKDCLEFCSDANNDGYPERNASQAVVTDTAAAETNILTAANINTVAETNITPAAETKASPAVETNRSVDTETNTPPATETNTPPASETNTSPASETNTSQASETNIPPAAETNTSQASEINASEAAVTNTSPAAVTNTSPAAVKNTSPAAVTNTSPAAVKNTSLAAVKNTSPAAETNTSTAIETNTSQAAETCTQDDEDSWDTMFDDDGDALDPKLMEELTTAVGKVEIQNTQFDYYNFQPKDVELDYSEYGHLIEIYDFPSQLITRDLLVSFQDYKDKGFDIKWVDDNHAIGIFSSNFAAHSALSLNHPLIKVRPISQATRQTKLKAKRCVEFLQPYKERPETSAAVARNLVAGALGIRSNVDREKRNEERKKLKEARDKKRSEKKLKRDAWEGSYGRCAMDEVN